MNTTLIFEILQLALSLAQSLMSGTAAPDTTAQSLLDIVQKGQQAYQQHTGQPLDPSLIKVEKAI
jgi:hypothetical protein